MAPVWSFRNIRGAAGHRPASPRASRRVEFRDAFDTRLTENAPRLQIWPSDTHGLCARGLGLDDIGAAAKAAVHQRHLRADHFDDLRQCVDHGAAAVVDEAAAVRDNDAINERGDV